MRIAQIHSVLMRGDAISNVIRANDRIQREAGMDSSIVLDFFSEYKNEAVEMADYDYAGLMPLWQKSNYAFKIGNPKLFYAFVKAALRYKRNKAKSLIDNARIRIWHYGLYYPLFKLIHENDIVYFYNFGYPYHTKYINIELATSNLLQQLRYIPLSFITSSRFNKETLLRMGFLSEDIAVIPLFHTFRLPYKSRHNSPPKLLAYGRYATNKSIPELARIANEAKLGLSVFGDNKTTKEYIGNFRLSSSFANDSVKLYGKVRDIDSFFKEANIYVCNSRHEGFNMPLIEAEAHSLPVLARRGTAMDELVREGWNGYLFDDASELPELAGRILKDYARFARNAWKHSQCYTLDAYRTSYLRLIRRKV